MNELWLQISAGQGPVECAWAVMRTLEEIEREARARSIEVRVIAIEPGPQAGIAASALLAIAGDFTFAESWCGTVQWIARSPFRPEHKRKNWFVGVEVLRPAEETQMKAGDLHWEVMRAAGPGGQHVNRTESAVRVTHVSTGLQAMAMEERSQHRNRSLALARLVRKIEGFNAARAAEVRQQRWRAHYELERGNPARVFRVSA